MKHISGERIQSYLDQKLKGLTPQEQEHLDSCQICSAAVEEYRTLYSELGRDDSIKLSPDFAKNTMMKIAAQESARSWFNITTMFWVVGVASCLAAIIYTIDIKALLDGAVAGVIDGSSFGSSALAAVKQWIVKSKHSMSILLLAAMILAGVALLDKTIVRQKLTTKSFLFSV